jgi:hypothetical protein
MSEHTPGPWLADGTGCVYSATLPKDDCVIAELQQASVNWDADACLIAAAPELLEACKQLHNCLSDWVEIADSDDLRDSDSEAIKLSVAAIAKAEGRGE